MSAVAGEKQIGSPRLRNALARAPQTTPPIWLMRQAGRYHSHYQNLRRQHSFMDLCKHAELAAEVALGPVLDFDFEGRSSSVICSFRWRRWDSVCVTAIVARSLIGGSIEIL